MSLVASLERNYFPNAYVKVMNDLKKVYEGMDFSSDDEVSSSSDEDTPVLSGGGKKRKTAPKRGRQEKAKKSKVVTKNAKQTTKKSAPKSTTTKQVPDKTAKVGAGGQEPQKGFFHPMLVSNELHAVIGGEDRIPRPTVVKNLWKYIKSNKLQDPQDGRQIQCDTKLRRVFGKSTVHMFEMSKLLTDHLRK